jgi:mannose-6-phosphate isomerase class I
MNIDLKDATMQQLETSVALPIRKTSQYLMPIKMEHPSSAAGTYNIYPVCSLEGNIIFNGYGSLAQWIIEQRVVVIDGYVGVFWHAIQEALDAHFNKAGLLVKWVHTAQYLKPVGAVESMVQPFLGSEDSVWGTKCSLSLSDLYETEQLQKDLPEKEYDINIVIGPGATLSNWNVPVIYIDLPKNELQFRMRAGSVCNIGSTEAQEPFTMYKRFYFVDWVLLNEHKKAIHDRIAVIADGQWPDNINWMFGSSLKEGLDRLSQSVLRVRPWFEPGAWGGQWIKKHIPQLNADVVNYAWSFELIVPENGIVFESNGYLLEVSFDFLMFCNREAVLGQHAARFGDEFPIRFDFLDTYEGGNLSIQCHPSVQYIREQFGENITQDETYYILDCHDDARVYLGFQENIKPEDFKEALITSQNEGVALQIEDYVQSLQANKHDLFLIPNQTVHSAGEGSLVLEISATPYIFTFKMYDWLRLDLDGKPRPINIEHAFNNLDFTRKGEQVQQELVSKPAVIEKGQDWQLVHLPTHAQHFYDIHRIEFANSIQVSTAGSCHVLMLVEGSSVMVQTANGTTQTFSYAETFVIPAAAQSYQLVNRGKGMAKVIKAFLK